MVELQLIRQHMEQAAGRACFTCSFQAEDVVMLHLLHQVDSEIPVLFLDTGYHFPDLLRYRDRLTESWGINLVNVRSRISREEQEARYPLLCHTNPAACCRIRKVEPLFEELETTPSGSRASAASSLRRAPTCSRFKRRRCPPAIRYARSARWPCGGGTR